MIFARFDAETVAQLTASGIFAGTAYGLLGVGFALILGVTGRFHFAYAFTYTLAAYAIFQLRDWSIPFWIAVVLGVLVTTAVGTGMERAVYRPLAAGAGATALLGVFVASLGLGIAGQNLISYHYTEQAKNLIGPRQTVHAIWEARFLNFDMWQAGSSAALVIILALLLRYTGLGRAIKATRVNPEMAQIIGINPNTIYLTCFAIGSAFSGVAAFWYGLKFTVQPEMGFRPVIFAFVVAFLAGTASSPIRVFVVGILVSLLQVYASIWLSARWTDLAVFVVLVAYLVREALKGRSVLARLFGSLIPARA